MQDRFTFWRGMWAQGKRKAGAQEPGNGGQKGEVRRRQTWPTTALPKPSDLSDLCQWYDDVAYNVLHDVPSLAGRETGRVAPPTGRYVSLVVVVLGAASLSLPPNPFLIKLSSINYPPLFFCKAKIDSMRERESFQIKP